ncbi:MULTISPECIES: hypothetical protein [Dietzia]|jgi:hypothetical protein|uniref:hypothetical protein n=1 Tax=Dietzia TaxID=37914 RepID=UPI001046B59A|nr:hypothetical protein [Dietzia sp. IN118]MDN5742981.1 hypothetical protein [Yaniella sp.]MDV3357347.1 hypothetical protein [Dietzia sp. IN118]
MKKLAIVMTLLAGSVACSSGGTAELQPASTPPTTNEATNAPAGALELAITQTCAPGSDPQCISVNGEHVLVVPAAFERAGVDSASNAQPSGESDTITVDLDRAGATVASRMTAEASQAGDQTRLVMKVGDEIISAVRVQDELRNDHMLVALPPGAPTEEILQSLNGPGE